MAGSSALLAIIIALSIVGGLAYWNLTHGLALSTSPQPSTSGFTAYCAPVVPGPGAIGVYPAGPGTTPPAGCRSVPTSISLTLTDLYNPGKALTSSYSCVFYWNQGAPATFAPTGPGVSITGGTWVVGPSVQAVNGVCNSPGSWEPVAGTQVVVKICLASATSCVAGGYSSQTTVAYCPLAASQAVSSGGNQTFPPQACDPGLGWGSVPFSNTFSTNAIFSAQAHIIMIAGQNPTGSNSGFNAANPVLLDERYQNGTDFTSASTCLVNTGSNACDLPKASSLGRFGMTWTLSTGSCSGCTAPANPQGSGYMDVTPVDLQSGSYARGRLQLVLSVEIVATSHADMCAITSSTLPGSPTIVQKSGSTSDIFYLYVVPPTLLTKITDVSGNALNVGSLQSTFAFDCNQVYNGSGDVVTITPIIYAYYSTAYIQSYHGTVLNPEAAVLTNSAVITIKT